MNLESLEYRGSFFYLFINQAMVFTLPVLVIMIYLLRQMKWSVNEVIQ